MRKMVKSKRSRKIVKIVPKAKPEKASKVPSDTVVTIEASLATEEIAEQSFTDCAHLRQVMCLLPSSNPASKGDKQRDGDSDDAEMSDGKVQAGNLELPGSKGVSAYMKVAKFATALKAGPSMQHVIKSGPKQKK